MNLLRCLISRFLAQKCGVSSVVVELSRDPSRASRRQRSRMSNTVIKRGSQLFKSCRCSSCVYLEKLFLSSPMCFLLDINKQVWKGGSLLPFTNIEKKEQSKEKRHSLLQSTRMTCLNQRQISGWPSPYYMVGLEPEMTSILSAVELPRYTGNVLLILTK